MAFFLTPRFAPAYRQQQCSPFACSPRQSYRISRPSIPSFVPFLSEVDELFSEIEREARREAHRQRQQRKRTFRAHFNVHEQGEGYQVDGEVPGFEQENFEIEVTDAHTLRVNGNTARKAQQAQQPVPQQQQIESAPDAEKATADNIDGATLNEPEARPASPAISNAGSNKSHQPTVEDDFEDLGAEASSTVSASSDSAPAEPKGKEKVAESSEVIATQKDVAQQEQEQPQPQPQQQQQDDTIHWSFERTFRFPERIDVSAVTATLKNGLLSVQIPKEKAPEVKKVLFQ